MCYITHDAVDRILEIGQHAYLKNKHNGLPNEHLLDSNSANFATGKRWDIIIIINWRI